MNNRIKTNSNWFLSHTGKRIWPLVVEPEDIDIIDIAHSLSLICRFNGHSKWHYSVAQHSLLVSRNLPENLKLIGLMHDATEAYCCDVIRPIKEMLSEYKTIEERVWWAICMKYGLQPDHNPIVKEADNRALMTERRDILEPSEFKWDFTELPYDERITRMSPEEAESKFIVAFEYLTS